MLHVLVFDANSFSRHPGLLVQPCAYPIEMLSTHVRIPARIHCANPVQIEGVMGGPSKGYSDCVVSDARNPQEHSCIPHRTARVLAGRACSFAERPFCFSILQPVRVLSECRLDGLEPPKPRATYLHATGLPSMRPVPSCTLPALQSMTADQEDGLRRIA